MVGNQQKEERDDAVSNMLALLTMLDVICIDTNKDAFTMYLFSQIDFQQTS